MKTNENKEIENIETNATEPQNENPRPEAKKQQKVSISYTLKAMANNTNKLEENKIIKKEEADELRKIHKIAVERWIGLEMGI